MAPEQCHGASDLDHRADVYALGCIAFEMLCGRPPFLGQGLGEILAAHMFQEPPRPSSLATMPADFEELILRMLAKPADARPPSMEPIIVALDGIRRGIAGAQMSGAMSVEVPPTLPPTVPPTLPPTITAPPPVAPITTLGASAGVIHGSIAGPRGRRWPLLVAVAMVVGGATTATIVVATRGAGAPQAVVPPDARSSVTACDGGDGHRCVDAGVASLLAKQPWHARDQFDRGCTLGVADACGRLAALLLRGAESVPVDAVRAMSTATRGCDASDGLACATLALAAARGDGMSPDAALAARAGNSACQAGNGMGCAIASNIAAVAGDAARSDTLARAASPKLVDACTAGDDASCIELADLRVRGRGIERDFGASQRVLQAACDRDSGEACNRLARVYELGQGVAPDLVRGQQLRLRARVSLGAACDLGRVAPCAIVGRQLALDHTTSRDAGRAAALLARACDGGEGDACVTLARMTEIGDGAVKNAERARELYRRARTLLDQRCMVADVLACNEVGALYSSTTGGAVDATRAAAAYHRACAGGSGDGCVGWASSDKTNALVAFRAALDIADAGCTAGDASACALGGGVRCLGPKELADPKTCADRYRKSCDAGLAEGCFDLGWAEAKGVAGSPDRDTARRYYGLACDKEYGPACNNLAHLRIEANDIEGAVAKFQAGCDDGDASSCVNLADLYDSGKHKVKDAHAASELRRRACVLGNDDSCE